MICTVLYVAVALVITGMVKYDEIDPAAALASAFVDVGKDGYATLISAGAVAGLTTVVMTLIIGAIRVTFAMCRDNLLPRSFAHVTPRTGTPVRITLTIGVTVAAGRLADADRQARGDGQHRHPDGLRAGLDRACRSCARKRPDLQRPFTVPFSPLLPWLSAAICVFLMLNLTAETWLRFLVWMAAGFAIYFAYGYQRSRVGRAASSVPTDEAGEKV